MSLGDPSHAVAETRKTRLIKADFHDAANGLDQPAGVVGRDKDRAEQEEGRRVLVVFVETELPCRRSRAEQGLSAGCTSSTAARLTT